MNKLFDLNKKTVMITGATGVLGESITRYLAEQGAYVLVLGRSKHKVNTLVANLKANNLKALPALADVTDEQSLKSLIDELPEIDVLINCAGGNMAGATVQPEQSIIESDTASLKKVMELNYIGSFLPIKTFLPLFCGTDKKQGVIINFSSMSASRPLTRVMGYSSAKAAIDNLTRWLAVEFAQKYGEGLRVNAIAPGFFLTEQNRSLLTQKNGNLTNRGQQIVDNTPMGRFGSPDELHGSIHYLCSEASKFVTGTILEVDGGFGAYSGV